MMMRRAVMVFALIGRARMIMVIMVVMMLMGLGTAFTIGMRASMHGSACHSCKNAEGEELLQDN